MKKKQSLKRDKVVANIPLKTTWNCVHRYLRQNQQRKYINKEETHPKSRTEKQTDSRQKTKGLIGK